MRQSNTMSPSATCPGTNSRAVAEMTLTLMLSALRRVPYYDARMRAGEGLDR